VRGGLVVYSNDLKHRLAGVDEALLADEGPVSAHVAAALARGARDQLDATFGVAVTGVAGPDQQAGQRVGTVYTAVAGPDSLLREQFRSGYPQSAYRSGYHQPESAGPGARPEEVRASVRRRAVDDCLTLLDHSVRELLA